MPKQKPNRFTHLVSAASTRTAPAPGKKPSKSKNPDYAQLFAYIPKELHLKLKVRCQLEGREISDVLAELVEKHLDGWKMGAPARGKGGR